MTDGTVLFLVGWGVVITWVVVMLALKSCVG